MEKKGLQRKALIIDDTKNIRLMLSKCLELEGYSVETADNGKSGLEYAQNSAYDLIFLDVKLPEISGTEVLRQLRANKILTPIIIITAYPTVKNAVDCTQLGAIAYLQKPFTTDRIHNVLCELNLETHHPQPFSNLSQIEILIENGDYQTALEKLKTEHLRFSKKYRSFGKVDFIMAKGINKNFVEKYVLQDNEKILWEGNPKSIKLFEEPHTTLNVIRWAISAVLLICAFKYFSYAQTISI